MSQVGQCVKNGFSDPTKEQIGQDQCRKDITNDHQEKAPKEGCHEENGLNREDKYQIRLSLSDG